MKRDMDLVRRILLALEAEPSPWGSEEFDVDGYDPATVNYHVMLMEGAGLINAHDQSNEALEVFMWHPVSLTWEGHEFLEASREEGRWSNAKALVKEKSGGLSFELLKDLLLQLGRAAVLGA